MRVGVSALVGLAVATVASAAGCGLDRKTSCRVDSDCLGARTCVQGGCVDPPSYPSEGGVAIGDASSDGVAVEAGAASGAVTLCDPLSLQGPCAPTSDGQPMTCYRASVLAGQDFCAPECDQSAPPQDPTHYACDPSGALLQRCHPDGDTTGRADCAQGLSCYRTNVLGDVGLCIRMPVCTTDADCPSSAYGTCAGTLLRSLVSDASPALGGALHIDHMNCLHADCQSELSACSSLEDCLGANFAGPFEDLCVPRCDSRVCPPNYACEVVFKNGKGEDLCVPSVPGARCAGTGCIAGECEDTGAGFSVCTLPCLVGCSVLDTSVDAFVCVTGGGTSHCVTASSFSGANCESSDECDADAGEFCASVDLFGPIAGHGECRLHCKADGTCDPRGGLPHGCLFDGGGGCFPAVLGVACTPDSGCIEPLACEDVPPEVDVPSMGTRVCSIPCGVDAGGDGDALCSGAAVGGYCAGGWCRPPRTDGQACDRNVQCRSGACDPVMRTCSAIPD